MKTDITKTLEKALFYYCNKLDQYPVEEVSLHEWGIVDTLSYQLKLESEKKGYQYVHVWRCYEIKVSKADFYSKARKTFIGHLNYFVMPKELYDEVWADIPPHIGVLVGNKRSNYKYLESVQRAKRQELKLDDKFIMRQFIGSQNREILKAKTILWKEELNDKR